MIYYWKVWFMPTGKIEIAKVEEDRVDYCLEHYPDDVIFTAELVVE